MKIKFVKEYRALQEDVYDIYEVGIIENMPETAAQWLIDNGFAEKAEDTKGGWKPKLDEMYYCLSGNGIIMFETWCNDELDESRYSMGNCFKTKESAERHRDYLEAIATVSHDEGFMKISRKINYSPCGYGVYRGFGKSIIAEVSDTTVSAGEFYFDTHEHAKASVEAHQPEWQTILNYDWSKGEEDEDEED